MNTILQKARQWAGAYSERFGSKALAKFLQPFGMKGFPDINNADDRTLTKLATALKAALPADAVAVSQARARTFLDDEEGDDEDAPEARRAPKSMADLDPDAIFAKWNSAGRHNGGRSDG